MKRFVASLPLLFALHGTLFAQQPGDPIALTVRPAELPQPSLKYPLFPPRGQMTEGNAPTQYYRALSMFVENKALLDDLQGNHWQQWLETSIKELPRKEVADKVLRARHLFRELEVGSKRKRCEWQLEGREEGIGLLIPDVQGFRNVGQALAVRARLHIAERNYSEACASLQTGYALAHHLGQGPTLIHVLVGMAIANLMTHQLEALVQQPDAPNLYWSLAALPRPFADLRPALHEETQWLDNMFPLLKKMDATPMSDEQVAAMQAKIAALMKEFGLREMKMDERVGRAFLLAQITAEGKRELVAHYKYTAEQVAAMPSFQVAALYSYREYKESLEEIIKWANVSEGWNYPEYKTAQARHTKAIKRLDDLHFRRLLTGLTDGLGFSLEKVSLSAARVDRRLAALRCVEAIRLHAAKHDGKLPATLADVKELPVANDPLTGKPFLYAAEGDKATLALSKPAEEKPNPNQLLTYVLTIKREKE